MPKNEKGKEKLIRLLEILIRYTDEEHGLTMAEIIEHLASYGISAERKSIYDDFAVLDGMGIPVLKSKDKHTRYSIDFCLFELAELKMLVDAVQSSKFITVRKSREIISRLETLTSVYHSRELSRQIYVEDRIKTLNNTSIYTVDTVHSAINSNHRLKFHYFEYDAEKNKRLRRNGAFYTVSPLSLLWSEENYYLVAYEEESDTVKHFRIDKMLDVREISESRSLSPKCTEFDPSDYSRKVFSMYGGREELVTFECREKLSGVMIDRFGMEHTFHKTDFGFRFSLRVMLSPTFYAWVMGFGNDIKIISPSSARDELVGILNKTRELYENE